MSRPAPARLVLRYLAAFGPASIRDVQVWSGITGLRSVVDRLRSRLRVFRDENGTELFDLPEAPRPDPDTPVPPRFLPEYDNVLLSHADRSRMVPAAHRRPVYSVNGIVYSSLLLGGFVRAIWALKRDRKRVMLVVRPLGRIAKRDRVAATEEGLRLLAFIAPGASAHHVQFAAAI